MDNEGRLKSGMAAGLAQCYQAAYDLYGPPLFRSACRMLGNQSDAEDVVQEVFAAVVRGRERLAQVADLKAYLFVTMRHAAARIALQRQRHAAVNLDDAKPAASANIADDRAERMWQLAASLPEEQRVVLVLKIQGELTFEQVAKVLDISPNTAASRYRYALQKLQQMVEKQQ